jgi:dephospho-CoA kinase
MSNKSLIIGLTGNIATGKSTILAYLAEKGAHVLDADKVAHKVMEPGGAAYQPIVQEFGRGVVGEDGFINRRVLGQIVFADAHKLGRLEQIVHPAVFEQAVADIAAAKANIIVIEAVKLLEAGLMVTLCDEVWVVTATPEEQMRRLMDKRGMDEKQALQRMSMQSPQAAKINQADRVIDNNGALEDLIVQLDQIWQELTQSYPERLVSSATE